jgi:hypothetical protein
MADGPTETAPPLTLTDQEVELLDGYWRAANYECSRPERRGPPP